MISRATSFVRSGDDVHNIIKRRPDKKQFQTNQLKRIFEKFEAQLFRKVFPVQYQNDDTVSK